VTVKLLVFVGLKSVLITSVTVVVRIVVIWKSMDAAWKDSDDIEAMLEPFLGGDDPIWVCHKIVLLFVVLIFNLQGTRFTGSIKVFAIS
jgi:hypothetical protein